MDGARDYRLIQRAVVDAILSMREYNRFSKEIFGWVGFPHQIDPVRRRRACGRRNQVVVLEAVARYSLEGIVAFWTVPLALASVLGVLLCLIAFVFILVVLVKTLAFGDPVGGWPSMICVILFLGGVQLLHRHPRSVPLQKPCGNQATADLSGARNGGRRASMDGIFSALLTKSSPDS